jgi:hypothetical protein
MPVSADRRSGAVRSRPTALAPIRASAWRVFCLKYEAGRGTGGFRHSRKTRESNAHAQRPTSLTTRHVADDFQNERRE